MAVSGVSHACMHVCQRGGGGGGNQSTSCCRLQAAALRLGAAVPGLPWPGLACRGSFSGSAQTSIHATMQRGVAAFVLCFSPTFWLFSRLLRADRQPCSHRAIVRRQLSLRARVAVQQCNESNCNVDEYRHSRILYRPDVLPYLRRQSRRLRTTIILYHSRV